MITSAHLCAGFCLRGRLLACLSERLYVCFYYLPVPCVCVLVVDR